MHAGLRSEQRRSVFSVEISADYVWVPMTAPPMGKGQIVDFENGKASDAQSFVAAFTGYLGEIILERKQSRGE